MPEEACETPGRARLGQRRSRHHASDERRHVEPSPRRTRGTVQRSDPEPRGGKRERGQAAAPRISA